VNSERRPQAGRIVTVFSGRGGAGATTVAVNLAAALAAGGRRQVCVLDLDLAFGDVATVLGLRPERSLADAARLGPDPEPNAVLPLLAAHSPGLMALTTGSRATMLTARQVAGLLTALATSFDHVVVDTPAAFDDQVLAAMECSSVLVTVAPLDVPAVRTLGSTLETYDLLGYPQDIRRVVLNRTGTAASLTAREVARAIHTPVDAQIRASRDIGSAAARGVPLVLGQPKHPVSTAFRRFADSLLVESTADRGVQSHAVTSSRSRIRRRAGGQP
jgi:pilus assembly protein CpaE